MPYPLSVPSIYRLSLDHWESIAFHLAAEGKTQGPPSELLSLLLVSRHVYANTCAKNNARLYARLFRVKFDCSAPQRRLSEGWMTDRCLARELIKRFAAMRRIRDRSYDFDDLWTCYLMMLENDGKNELHLLNWANLRQYLVALVIARAHASPQVMDTDPTTYALTIWLMWMTSSRESFKTEHPEFLNHLFKVLRPLLAAGYQHPSSYALDTCFHLPLCGPPDLSSLSNHRCSGPDPPKAARLIHYSHALTISYPLATTAATLLWALTAESLQDEKTFPTFRHPLPANRQAVNVPGFVGPTLEDIIDFHYHVRVNESYSSATGTVSQRVTNSAAEKSSRYDEDWSRLVSCHDLTLGNTPLRGPVYEVGSLCGRWAGRFMLPHLEAYMDTLLGRRSAHAVPLHQKPLYWTLHEHHSLSPDETLSIGIDESGVDDVLNGWLPRGCTLEEVEGAIVVHDPYTEQPARYETFIPGNAAHYSKQACEKVVKEWISSTEDVKEIAVEENGLVPGAATSDDTNPGIDNDEEYTDHAEHLSSGVSDILVTGETGSPGDAWGHYKIIGRVRPWDGFIVLVQIPDPYPVVSHQGQWIFKGYIHDRNFVGRWRETSTTVGSTGLEGSFVMTRRDIA